MLVVQGLHQGTDQRDGDDRIGTWQLLAGYQDSRSQTG